MRKIKVSFNVFFYILGLVGVQVLFRVKQRVGLGRGGEWCVVWVICVFRMGLGFFDLVVVLLGGCLVIFQVCFGWMGVVLVFMESGYVFGGWGFIVDF